MRLVTWNVNSVRQRLPRLLGVLSRHEPSIVCLQETKVADEDFPASELRSAGYHSASYGQKAYNGVAILAREPLTDVRLGFPNDPAPQEARVLAATIGDLRVVDVYVVNGKSIADPAYGIKLAWLDALTEHLAATEDPATPLIMTGDFNVAPSDLDVHDAHLWASKNLASEPERERIRRLAAWGLVDLGRSFSGPDEKGPFSWWDYRAGAFHLGWGLRLDLILGTAPVAERLVSVLVDRDERKPTSGEGKPSDHAPVILTLNDDTA